MKKILKYTKDNPMPPNAVRKGSRIFRPLKEKDNIKVKVKEPKKPNFIIKKIRYIYFRIKESKIYVKLKYKGLPYIFETLIKLFSVLLSSFCLMLVLNLFKLINISLYTFIKCIALYYIIEELRYFLNHLKRGKK